MARVAGGIHADAVPRLTGGRGGVFRTLSEMEGGLIRQTLRPAVAECIPGLSSRQRLGYTRREQGSSDAVHQQEARIIQHGRQLC
jgi:hypothetical protein